MGIERGHEKNMALKGGGVTKKLLQFFGDGNHPTRMQKNQHSSVTFRKFRFSRGSMSLYLLTRKGNSVPVKCKKA